MIWRKIQNYNGEKQHTRKIIIPTKSKKREQITAPTSNPDFRVTDNGGQTTRFDNRKMTTLSARFLFSEIDIVRKDSGKNGKKRGLFPLNQIYPGIIPHLCNPETTLSILVNLRDITPMRS